MKILHAVHGYPPEFRGGTELYVQRLAQHQHAAGHEVLVAAGSGTTGRDGFVATAEHGVRIFRIANTALFHERWDRSASPWVDANFRRLLADQHPDIVHVHHWLRMGRGLLRQARAGGIPAVLTAHDLFVSCPRAFRVRADEAFCERPLGVDSCLHCVPRETWMPDAAVALHIAQFAADMQSEMRAAPLVVAPSRAHAQLLRRFADLPDDCVVSIPHGASLDVPHASAPALDAWRPGSARPLRLAHWGHLDAVKGVHVLLGAMARLKRSTALELVLWGTAGDPEYATRLDRLSNGLRIERRGTFTPADLCGLRADLAVFPSLAHESYSFTLDEALALRLPMLVSDRGALPERCGGGGLAFAPGDEAALGHLLRRVLDEPDLLAALSAAVPHPVSLDEHWRRLERVYRQVRARETPATCTGGDDAQDRERWERLVRSYEDRARELDGLRAKAESEGRNQQATIDTLLQSGRDSQARIAEQETDLVNHRSELARANADLANHRRELARVNAENTTLCQELMQRRRESRLALPLVLPARFVLRLWDRLKKSTDA